MKARSPLFSHATKAKLQKHWAKLSPTAKRMVEALDDSATQYQQATVKHLALKRHES